MVTYDCNIQNTAITSWNLTLIIGRSNISSFITLVNIFFVEISRAQPCFKLVRNTNFILDHSCQYCHLVGYLHTRHFWAEPAVFPHKHTFLCAFYIPYTYKWGSVANILSCQSRQCSRKSEQNVEMRHFKNVKLSLSTLCRTIDCWGCFLEQQESVWCIVNMFFNFKSTSLAKVSGFKVSLRSYIKTWSEVLDAAHTLYFLHDLPGKTPLIMIAGVGVTFDSKKYNIFIKLYSLKVKVFDNPSNLTVHCCFLMQPNPVFIHHLIAPVYR